MPPMAGLAARDITRSLAIIAHPDDAEFWIGGTVARWTAAGVQVTYAILTDGEGGGFDPDVPRSAIPSIRRAEQKRAAESLDVHELEFLGHGEGQLEAAGQDLHLALVRLIRRVRPQVVVTWSPEWNWQRFRSCHPDHLATGTLALRAIYPDAGNRFAFPFLAEDEGLEPWTVSQVWLINSPEHEINHHVDVTDTFDRKVEAVQAHYSQVGNRRDLAGKLRDRITPNATKTEDPDGRLFESFQVVQSG